MISSDMSQIVDYISYKPGWKLRFTYGQRDYVQLEVTEESDSSLDSYLRDGTRTPWKSGKRYLSEFMCRQEIVGVCFDLIKSAEEHEMREWFRYKGASIFNPHLDPDVLVDIAKKKASFCVREDSMTNA